MTPVARADCRTIAPLLARYNDPDLSEAEQICLSLHLYRCPVCAERLREYRALDGWLRVMPAITIAPQVRSAVLQQIAATAGADPHGHAATMTWRQSWPTFTVALSLVAFVLVVGLTTGSPPRLEANLAATAVTREAFNPALGPALSPALATTFLAATPTRVVGGFAVGGVAVGGINDTLAVKLPIAKPQPTRPAAVVAIIRSIDTTESRITVTLDGAKVDERLAVMGDTAIVLADGRPGTLSDLAIGAQVRLQREISITGGLVAREIRLPR